MTNDTGPRVSRWAVPLLGVMGAVQGADVNVASTALVGASRGLGMGGSLLALAASISTLALSATVISTGLVADRSGRRKTLIAALALAAAGDLIAGSAPVPAVFLLGRALAGIGLGAVFGASFAYVKDVAVPGRIPAALGVFGAVAGAGTLLLTFVGGALSSMNWRFAFVVIPLIALVCILGVKQVLPAVAPAAPVPADVPGQLLLGVGIIGVLYGFSHSARSVTDLLTVAPFLVGVLLMVLFFWREQRIDSRFFPVQLFRNPVFVAAVCAGFVYNFGNAVGFLQLTNLWQFINGLTTLEVSVWQLPLLGAGIVAALVFGRLMTRGLSAANTIAIGSICAAVGFVFLAVLHNSGSLAGFLPGSVLVGGGVIIASLPFGSLIISQAPQRYYGPVTSSRTTIGQFFFAAGLALSTVLVNRITVGGISAKLDAAGVPPTQTGQGLDAVTAFAAAGTQPTTSLGRQALADGAVTYGSGFAITMILTAVLIVIVGSIAVVLLRRAESRVPTASVAAQPSAP